jgi:predicted transcriptional regulator
MMLSSSSKRNRKRMCRYYGIGEGIQIIARILNYCLEYRERTSVIEDTGLDQDQVNYCLGYLFRRGYIRIGISPQGNLFYKTREKGKSLLDFYYHMMQEYLQYHKNMIDEIKENYVSTFEQEPNILKLCAF